MERERDAPDRREIRRATGIGEGPSISRRIVGIEQVLQPEVEAMAPLIS